MRRMMLIAFTFVVISMLGASSAGAVVIDMGALRPVRRRPRARARRAARSRRPATTTVNVERAVHATPGSPSDFILPEQRPLLQRRPGHARRTRRSRSPGIRIGSTGRRRGTMSSSSSRTSPTAARAPNEQSIAVLAVRAHQPVSRRAAAALSYNALRMAAAASTSVSPAGPRASFASAVATGPGHNDVSAATATVTRQLTTSGRTRAACGARTPTHTASPTTRSAPRSRRWSATWGSIGHALQSRLHAADRRCGRRPASSTAWTPPARSARPTASPPSSSAPTTHQASVGGTVGVVRRPAVDRGDALRRPRRARVEPRRVHGRVRDRGRRAIGQSAQPGTTRRNHEPRSERLVCARRLRDQRQRSASGCPKSLDQGRRSARVARTPTGFSASSTTPARSSAIRTRRGALRSYVPRPDVRRAEPDRRRATSSRSTAR